MRECTTDNGIGVDLKVISDEQNIVPVPFTVVRAVSRARLSPFLHLSSERATVDRTSSKRTDKQ